MSILPGTELTKIKLIKEKENTATFIIEPLQPGYGMTLGNALRRILLTSLPGSAITWVKIAGCTHEFSTLPGVKEDIVDIILNLKGLKVKLNSATPEQIKLVKKGPAKVTANDFAKNPLVKIANPLYHLATLDKKGKIEIIANIENGRGYVTVEQYQNKKLPLGTIVLDSIFTPIKKVHYEVEHTRVGGMTNFDKLIINLATDGTIDPEEAIETAAKILVEHFQIIAEINKEKKIPTYAKKITKITKKSKKVKKIIKTKKISKKKAAKKSKK